MTGPRYDPLDVDPSKLPEILRPAIDADLAEAEKLRRLPDRMMAALRQHGAFRLLTPIELGGFEVSLRDAIEILHDFGRIYGSVTWVLGNANVGVWAAALPPEGVAAIWASGPDPVIASSGRTGKAVVVDGGVRLTGRWDFCSGSDAAERYALFAMIEGLDSEAGPARRICWVPRSDVTVLDTWDAAGMRGTGSNSVITEDVFVPDHLVSDPTIPLNIDRPMFRIPPRDVVAASALGSVLGVVRAALDELITVIRQRPAQAARPNQELAIGQADLLLRAAYQLGLALAADIDAAAEANEPITEALTAPLNGAIGLAGQTARQVLAIVQDLAGASAVMNDSQIGRLIRDGLAVAHTDTVSPNRCAVNGRAILELGNAGPRV